MERDASFWLRRRLLLVGIATAAFGALAYASVPLLAWAATDSPGRARAFADRLRHEVHQRALTAPWQVLTTPSRRNTDSPLPTLRLEVDGKHLDRLNSDLPASGNTYVPGRLVVHDLPGRRTSWNAKVRYRGDTPIHWDSIHRSWRVKLPRGEHFDGGRRLNVVNPKTRNGLTEYLNSWIARRMGLLAPRVRHVGLVLNNQWRGVYLLVDQIDEHFLQRQGLPEGTIFYGEQLGGNLFDDVTAWRAAYSPDENVDTNAVRRLVALTNESDDGEFAARVRRLFDLDELLKYVAYFQFCSSVHTDNGHNHKYYVDPVSGRLRPIVWDALGLGDASLWWYGGPPPGEVFVPFERPANRLFTRIRLDPLLAHRKNELLWHAINGPLRKNVVLAEARRVYASIRRDMRFDLYKDAQLAAGGFLDPVTNAEFDASFDRLLLWIERQDERLRSWLADARLEAWIDNLPPASVPYDGWRPLVRVELLAAGWMGSRWSSVHVTTSAGGPFAVFEDRNDNGLIDGADRLAGTSLPDPTDGIVIKLNELLLPGRRRNEADPRYACGDSCVIAPVPRRFTYILAGRQDDQHGAEGPVRGIELVARSGITGAQQNVEISLGRAPRDVPLARAATPMSDTHEPLRIGPGVVVLHHDLVVEAWRPLEIAPGTDVRLAPQVSIVSRGPVSAVGLPDDPITFGPIESPQEPWGVLALQGRGASGSVFAHCRFSGGGEAIRDGVHYTGMLAAHAAGVELEHCVFRNAQGDDAFNAKQADAVINHCTFVDNRFDAVDYDFCGGAVRNSVFSNNGNDAIDLGSAWPAISTCWIEGSGDKGISAGERSRPLISDCVIKDCNVGLASKDQAEPLVTDCRFVDNQTAVSSYRKKLKFGGGNGRVVNCLLERNGRLYWHDALSATAFERCLVDTARPGAAPDAFRPVSNNRDQRNARQIAVWRLEHQVPLNRIVSLLKFEPAFARP